jgi:hypothetical protein
MLGHYARDCPQETGAGMHQSAHLNMLSAQGASQEHHTLTVSFQNQVSLQQQLLLAQAELARQDKTGLTSILATLGAPSPVGAAMPQGVGTSLALLPAPPAVAQAQMILGDAQPAGYVYILKINTRHTLRRPQAQRGTHRLRRGCLFNSLFVFCCMLHVWILLGIYAPLIGVLCGASALVFDLFY